MTKSVVQAALRGAGQVFFVGSPIAGALFIAAVAAASLSQALGAVLGLLVATLVGRSLGEPTSWAKGLHGYNGLLIGIAMVAFRGLSPGIAAAIVVGAALSAATLDAVTRMGRTMGAAPLTAPFIVVTLVLLVACRAFDVGAAAPAGPPIEAASVGMTLVVGTVRGLGQVFLQAEVLSGAFVLAGMLVASWRLAAMAVAGAFVGALAGVVVDCPPGEVAGGLLGYDAALAAVGVAVLVGQPGVRGVALSVVVALIATLTAMLLATPFAAVGLPRLTSAFVIVTVVVLVVRHVAGRHVAGGGEPARPST